MSTTQPYQQHQHAIKATARVCALCVCEAECINSLGLNMLRNQIAHELCSVLLDWRSHHHSVLDGVRHLDLGVTCMIIIASSSPVSAMLFVKWHYAYVE